MASETIKPLAYTMDEAAARMRIGRRSLQELVKRYPFYYANGHRKLFTEDDIAALVQAMRPVAPLHSAGVLPIGVRRPNRFAGRINTATLAAAQKAFAKKPR